MAKNLQAKLAPSDSIRIFDINQSAVHQLAEDMKASQTGGAVVTTAETAQDAARDSVRTSPLHFQHPFPIHIMSIFYP